jgi:hypothetical protein
MDEEVLDFHVLRFLWLKNLIRAKKIRLSRAVAVAEICLDAMQVPMKAIKLNFGSHFASI